MQITPFRALLPDMAYITAPDSFFGSVKEEFAEYYAGGFFQPSNNEAIFPYRIQRGEYEHLGLVACAPVTAYQEEHIRRHENTLAEKVQQQLQLVLRRGAAVKPILLIHTGVTAISDWIEKHAQGDPCMDITFEHSGEHHQLWEVTNKEDIAEIITLFADQVPLTYIADGHHRASSMNLLHERLIDRGQSNRYGHLLCSFFPSETTQILDYNRTVTALEEISPTRFLALISQVCEIEPLDKGGKPQEAHTMTMLVLKEWYLLRWKPEVVARETHAVPLDAALLDHYILKQILGIEDIRNDKRVGYVQSPKGWEEVHRRCLKNKNEVGFCLYPVRFDQLKAVVDAGEVMPPKSTWFEPRMRNGVIVQPLMS